VERLTSRSTTCRWSVADVVHSRRPRHRRRL